MKSSSESSHGRERTRVSPQDLVDLLPGPPVPLRHPGRWIACGLVALLVLATSVGGCSDDTNEVEVAQGLIISDPMCEDGSGQFELLVPQGTVLFIFIAPQTRIAFSDGESGSCVDLMRNATVEVNGTITAQSISASSITIQ